MVGYSTVTQYQFRFGLPRGLSSIQAIELPEQGLLALNFVPQMVVLLEILLLFAAIRTLLDAQSSSDETVTVDRRSVDAILKSDFFDGIVNFVQNRDSTLRASLRLIQGALICLVYLYGAVTVGPTAGDAIADHVIDGQAIESLPTEKITQNVHVYLKEPAVKAGGASDFRHPNSCDPSTQEAPALTQIWQTDRRLYFINKIPLVCSKEARLHSTKDNIRWTAYETTDIFRLTYDRTGNDESSASSPSNTDPPWLLWGFFFLSVALIAVIKIDSAKRVFTSPVPVINPAVDRVTFLETGHRERLTLVGIGAGVNL
jgi:hypothetical protein